MTRDGDEYTDTNTEDRSRTDSVDSTEAVAPIVLEAFHLARHGRPGPVVIDIPKTSQRRRLPIRV